jgi:hypothetical protein
VFFLSVIALGAARPNPYHPGVPHNKDEFGLLLLQVLWYGSWASCIFWIWHMRGIRWIAAFAMLGMQLLVAGSLFMAGMSISGDWI